MYKTQDRQEEINNIRDVVDLDETSYAKKKNDFIIEKEVKQLNHRF